jgi:uncharacterized membrane protein
MEREDISDEETVDAPTDGSKQAPSGGQQAPSGGQGSHSGHSQGSEHGGGQQAGGQGDGGQQVADGGQPAPGRAPQGGQAPAGGPAPGGSGGYDTAPGGSGTGLDENVAGALSYLLGVLTGVLFFVVDKDRPFVRFHAAQSMVVFGGFFVAAIVLSIVGGIVSAIAFSGGVGGAIVGGLLSLVLLLVWLVVGFGSLVAWLYLMYKAYNGETPRVPIAAGIADKLAN